MVGLSASNETTLHEWAAMLNSVGRVVSVPIGGVLPVEACVAWVIVLDARTPPLTHLFWLRQIQAPLVLVTPHWRAAQALHQHLGHWLKVVAEPTHALRDLQGVVQMAIHTTGGLTILPHERSFGDQA